MVKWQTCLVSFGTGKAGFRRTRSAIFVSFTTGKARLLRTRSAVVHKLQNRQSRILTHSLRSDKIFIERAVLIFSRVVCPGRLSFFHPCTPIAPLHFSDLGGFVKQKNPAGWGRDFFSWIVASMIVFRNLAYPISPFDYENRVGDATTFVLHPSLKPPSQNFQLALSGLPLYDWRNYD